MPGPVLFARYAYPPNALGYCGPADSAGFLGMASEGADLRGLSRLATQFAGAWPYLQLIAGCNGIAEPLDPRVVEAYWTGNELVTRVPPSALATSLDDRFERRDGPQLGHVMPAAPGGVPQHNFHVFAVYPWLGLLRAGMDGPPLEVLDRCRIRWGHVEAVTADHVTVRSRRLRFEDSRLTLGAEQIEHARHSFESQAFTTDLRPSDAVSLHWDWVCDRLSPESLGWLRYCTSRNLHAVNALAPPGPAAVCGA
ncbi:MAG TPA: DUF6390 family protein [Acidimicrobiales bacterium]|nr:DUF6390 family protein [Acidimicrobiales bacterium]